LVIILLELEKCDIIDRRIENLEDEKKFELVLENLSIQGLIMQLFDLLRQILRLSQE
jgi:hypothetical protein